MKETNRSQIGERIKAERKRLELSQDEAGRFCGVTRETWGKYERGVFEMGVAVFRAFVAAGADPDFIMTGIQKSDFDDAITKTTPVHMRQDRSGQRAALLRHYDFVPEQLQDVISVLAETLANLHANQTS